MREPVPTEWLVLWKFDVPHLLGKNAKRAPHKPFGGGFWGSERGSQTCHLGGGGHKKCCLLFFACPSRILLELIFISALSVQLLQKRSVKCTITNSIGPPSPSPNPYELLPSCCHLFVMKKGGKCPKRAKLTSSAKQYQDVIWFSNYLEDCSHSFQGSSNLSSLLLQFPFLPPRMQFHERIPLNVFSTSFSTYQHIMVSKRM